jgi:hypothetical protein
MCEQAQLLKECEVVFQMPILGNTPVDDSINIGRDEMNRLSAPWHTLELASEVT